MRLTRPFAALAAAIALLSLWSVERVQLDCDLQLAAPESARPGDPIALRALVFCELDALAGPRLVTPPVEVRLRDAAGRELSRESLAATELDTLDGRLVLPHGPRASYVLDASAQHEGRTLSCRRTIRVDPALPAKPPIGREAGPLQQYALGRVRSVSGAIAPDRMLPRVLGGACVPDVPCQIVVWVGEPAAALSVRGGDVQPLEEVGETAGLVAFELTVRGPEAEITLEARRAGALVAERALRVPVALGEVALVRGAGLLGSAQALSMWAIPPPGRSLVGMDVFTEGRWGATRVLPAHGGGDSMAPGRLFAHVTAELPLPDGLSRLQARSDRFGSEGSGARMVYVRAPGQGDAAALSAIAAMPMVGERPDAAWADALPAFALAKPALAAAFLLAPLEGLRAEVPAPVSGRPAQLAQLGRTKVRMRYGVAAALALSAWLVALSIARRGLLAVDEAQAILREAREEQGEPPGQEPGPHRQASRERINARAKVLLMVLAVGLAFLAGALLIAAKPLWF